MTRQATSTGTSRHLEAAAKGSEVGSKAGDGAGRARKSGKGDEPSFRSEAEVLAEMPAKFAACSRTSLFSQYWVPKLQAQKRSGHFDGESSY